MERVGAQGVTLVVSLVLARLLDPNVYGTIALVTVFIAIMQVFVDSGMGNALIQKKDADEVDFSSLFYFNIVICLLLYTFMFFASPIIAKFYNRPNLIPIIRVQSLTLIISGVKNIQQAYVARHMLFKKFFFSTLTGTIVAAIIGIWMAWRGYGVWSLVTQNLVNSLIDTIILWLTVKWRPRLVFSFNRIKALLSYGWKLLASALLDVGYNELRTIIIGKIYTSEDLAFFNRGKQLPNFLVTNINNSIDSVLFPAMSSEQDNPNRVRDMTRRAIKTSSYVIMPMMIGVMVCAEPLVRLLLTEKWLPCVFFLRIFCVTFSFYPIHTANLNAIKATGRSDIFLKLELLKKIVGIIALAGTMFISVEAMAYSLLATTMLCLLINSWPNKKLINYSFVDQIMDILPNLVLSGIMGTIVYAVNFLNLTEWLTLAIQIIIGFSVYFLLSILFKIESYHYVKYVIKRMSSPKR